ncbi:MAG: DUF3500 domain-containing protein [Candidatus Latescibacteria bacterium]|nr:DUF3500 domain-containing protein [Candidatus Latescibacterota bacterium]
MDLRSIYQEAATAQLMAAAATAWLAALRPDQRTRAALDFADDSERTNWHYIPRDRAGLPLRDMDGPQRQLAHSLVGTGLSGPGHERARTIIGLEEVLAEVEGTGRRFPRDPELYYLSVFGTPGSQEPWGWRFEGHHISLNYTVLEGCMVAPTPLFFGSNPACVRHGARQGLRALALEEDRGRDLLALLDGEQTKQAVIAVEAPDDILTTNQIEVGDSVHPQGLAGADMDAGQLQALKDLVGIYVDRLPEQIAQVERGKVERADWAHAHFAWAGAQEREQGHYYRVQGPTFVAEYDNTQNDANHIHAVWRDLNNDFGADLLRQHYRRDH